MDLPKKVSIVASALPPGGNRNQPFTMNLSLLLQIDVLFGWLYINGEQNICLGHRLEEERRLWFGASHLILTQLWVIICHVVLGICFAPQSTPQNHQQKGIYYEGPLRNLQTHSGRIFRASQNLQETTLFIGQKRKLQPRDGACLIKDLALSDSQTRRQSPWLWGWWPSCCTTARPQLLSCLPSTYYVPGILCIYLQLSQHLTK